MTSGNSGSAIRADLEPKQALFGCQTLRPAGTTSHNLGKGFGEGATWTAVLKADKATYPEAKNDRDTGPRQVSHCSLVVAMNVSREGCAARAGNLNSCRVEVSPDAVVVRGQLVEAEKGGARKEKVDKSHRGVNLGRATNEPYKRVYRCVARLDHGQ